MVGCRGTQCIPLPSYCKGAWWKRIINWELVNCELLTASVGSVPRAGGCWTKIDLLPLLTRFLFFLYYYMGFVSGNGVLLWVETSIMAVRS